MLLRGGMDGLSMVVPHGDAGYYQARSTIALPRPGEDDGLLPLDRMFGLHPAMAPLHPFWASKQLAFVHASGSPDPSRSHFDAQDFMESGIPGNKSAPGGWLNRPAGVLAGPNATPASQRMHALNPGPTMPRIFSGPALVTSMDSLRGSSRLADGSRTAEAFARLYRGRTTSAATCRKPRRPGWKRRTSWPATTRRRTSAESRCRRSPAARRNWDS
ncbi:hypothetical protein HK414_09965 [Ramlibacter terrae]|uniref:Uncharacterized protein n=1 Tax=Ramlibacter terrae TaxID=2732511 RepID=A0ABX6P536_9BURK|nr:hypothetical protein HK414_09965 [Ramlibacter terrae]